MSSPSSTPATPQTDTSVTAFAKEPPKVTILSDHAARGTPEIGNSPDFLDLRTRLAAVYDILRHRHTRCPITVGIYGDWGSGKTSAMRWLETRLHEWNAQTPEERGEVTDKKTQKVTASAHPIVHPVWFDPWKYHTKEEVWRGIISEVILAMLKVRSLRGTDKKKALGFAARRFGAFLGRAFLKGLSHVKLSFGDKDVHGAEAEISGEVFEDIHEQWKQFSQPEKGYLNEFEDALAEFIRLCLPNEVINPDAPPHLQNLRFKERIVLFIDDLDRCLPEVTLQVLEALKLYLNIPALLFVVGLDERVVQSIVHKHYDTQGVGQDKSRSYLAKLFQVELHIAPSDTQMEGYLGKQLAALNDATGNYWDDTLGEQYRAPIHTALNRLAAGNPREIKRLLNSALIFGRSLASNAQLLADAGPDGEKITFARGVALYFIRYLVRERYYGSLLGRFDRQKEDLQWLEHASKLRQQLSREPSTYQWEIGDLDEIAASLSRWEKLTAEEKKKCPSRPWRLPTDKDNSDYHHLPLVTPGWQETWASVYHEQRPRDKDGPIQSEFFTDPVLWQLLSIPFLANVALQAPASALDRPSALPAAFDFAALPPLVQERLLAAAEATRETISDEHLARITELDLDDTGLTDAHTGFLSRCTSQKWLELRDCTGLNAADKLPPSLTDLDLDRCTGLSAVDKLPSSLTRLSLFGCTGLNAVDKLPPSLTMLDLSGCTGLSAVDKLPPSLTELYLSGCTGLSTVDKLPRSLAELDLSDCTGLSAVDNLPPSLTSLSLNDCTGLSAVDKLPPSLTTFELSGCTGLSVLDNVPSSLTWLDLEGCTGLSAEALERVKARLGATSTILWPDGSASTPAKGGGRA